MGYRIDLEAEFTKLGSVRFKNKDTEPKPDLAECSTCGGSFPVDTCPIEPDGEGDWESGYHDVHVCPRCKDGGCIDNYSMSPKRAREWHRWDRRIGKPTHRKAKDPSTKTKTKTKTKQ